MDLPKYHLWLWMSKWRKFCPCWFATSFYSDWWWLADLHNFVKTKNIGVSLSNTIWLSARNILVLLAYVDRLVESVLAKSLLLLLGVSFHAPLAANALKNDGFALHMTRYRRRWDISQELSFNWNKGQWLSFEIEDHNTKNLR